MKLWCKKIYLYAEGIEPRISLDASSPINHYTTNTLTCRDIDTEVFTPGTIPRLNLGNIPAIAGKTNLGQFPAIAGKKPCRDLSWPYISLL